MLKLKIRYFNGSFCCIVVRRLKMKWDVNWVEYVVVGWGFVSIEIGL